MTGARSGDALGLTGRGLVKRYGARTVVDRVDLEVGRGEVVGLLGPNGAGKSTVFNLLAGLARPDAGEVWLGADAVTRWPLHRRARRGLGLLPQETSVFRGLTVEENLHAVLSGARRDRATRVDAAMARFGLSERRRQRAERLSGGERRRLELARALITGPRWLLMDEPFAGVDPAGVRDLQDSLRVLPRDGLGVLVSDHRVESLLPVCDRVYLLVSGRVVARGTAAEVAADPVARATYLDPGATPRLG